MEAHLHLRASLSEIRVGSSFVAIAMPLMGLLKLPHILNRMLTRYKAEIAVVLNSQILKNYLNLIVFADDMVLLISVFLRFFGAILVIFVARRQREAGVSLK